MIKFPFIRSAREEDRDTPSAAFLAYCRDELERRRDAGLAFDEELFKAAVDLAVTRLQAIERDEGKA